jgi:6-phosphofructokinase 1
LVILAEGVGGSVKLSETIQEVTGIDTRITTLGHIQRGGSPTVNDVILASKLGAKAVEILLEEKSGKVVGIRNGKIIDEDIDEALARKQIFDDELFDLSGSISK